MRVCVFGLALLIAGIGAAMAQNGKVHPPSAVDNKLFDQYEICLMLPGIFSSYSLDERLTDCTAVIASGKYSGSDLGKIYLNRAAFYAKKGDSDGALADIEMSHKLWPDSPRPLINRAAINMQRHQFDAAFADLNQVLADNPHSYAALTNRASIYFYLNKYDLAANDLDKALDANWTGDTAMLLRGEIAAAKGDYTSAMDDFAQSISFDPDKPHAYNADCYTRALARSEMEKTGLPECNKALELDPGEPAFLDSRGFLYLKLGRYADAVADYDAALAKNPKLAPTLYGRGLAKEKLGDEVGAAADIAAAKAQFPDIDKMFDMPASFAWRHKEME
jgi:tetratricopeptide (TPR) repeat protein